MVVEINFLNADKNKKLHPAWKTLKGKYAEVLKAKNIKFDKKLGPMLDKRATTIKAVQGMGNVILGPLAKGHLASLKSNAKAMIAAADIYLDRVEVLQDPAKKEFVEFLEKVKKAAITDTNWATVKINTINSPKKKK